MLTLQTVKSLNLRSFAVTAVTHTTRAYSSSNGKDNASSSDDEKEPKKAVDNSEESAVKRLNRLLASMQTDDAFSAAANNLTRPGAALKRRKEAAKQEADKKNVFVAAKSIANMLGSNETDKRQTESELLYRLLGHTTNKSANSATADSQQASKTTESELNLSELIVGMKIDRSQQSHTETRSEFVRRRLAFKGANQQYQRAVLQTSKSNKFVKREAEAFTGSVNLFGGEPLGIFKQTETLMDSEEILSTWAQLNKRELKLQVTHPPANYFEKMARWTEQGKVWRFPIDNEQDMYEEADVDFSEHIFLEQHLEPWCPTKGPIRHFMELVCVGLSKNPYITAKDKKEHILWFRDYFEAKKDVLRDLIKKDHIEKTTSAQEQVTA